MAEGRKVTKNTGNVLHLPVFLRVPLVELNEMGLPGMSATLDEMYRSPRLLELDPLTAIANLVEPEYQKKINKRI